MWIIVNGHVQSRAKVPLNFSSLSHPLSLRLSLSVSLAGTRCDMRSIFHLAHIWRLNLPAQLLHAASCLSCDGNCWLYAQVPVIIWYRPAAHECVWVCVWVGAWLSLAAWASCYIVFTPRFVPTFSPGHVMHKNLLLELDSECWAGGGPANSWHVMRELIHGFMDSLIHAYTYTYTYRHSQPAVVCS